MICLLFIHCLLLFPFFVLVFTCVVILGDISGLAVVLLGKGELVALLWLFVCFAALRPKSTAMVMARRSVHLNALFPGQA